MLFGRAIKNEYLALGTIISTAAIAYASTGSKKQSVPSGRNAEETIQKVKESVPLNASSRCVPRFNFVERD